MKKQYQSPEIKTVLFAPAQTVASYIIDFDKLDELTQVQAPGKPTDPSKLDIRFTL